MNLAPCLLAVLASSCVNIRNLNPENQSPHEIFSFGILHSKTRRSCCLACLHKDHPNVEWLLLKKEQRRRQDGRHPKCRPTWPSSSTRLFAVASTRSVASTLSLDNARRPGFRRPPSRRSLALRRRRSLQRCPRRRRHRLPKPRQLRRRRLRTHRRHRLRRRQKRPRRIACRPSRRLRRRRCLRQPSLPAWRQRTRCS